MKEASEQNYYQSRGQKDIVCSEHLVVDAGVFGLEQSLGHSIGDSASESAVADDQHLTKRELEMVIASLVRVFGPKH